MSLNGKVRLIDLNVKQIYNFFLTQRNVWRMHGVVSMKVDILLATLSFLIEQGIILNGQWHVSVLFSLL